MRGGLLLGAAMMVTATSAWSEPAPTDLFAPDWSARVAKAERLLGPAVRKELGEVPVQRRFDTGARAMLDPLVQPVWADGGRAFYYWGPDRALYRAEPAAGRRDLVADWTKIESALAKAGAPAAKSAPEVKLAAGKPVLDFKSADGGWRVDPAAGLAERLAPRAKAPDGLSLSEDGQAAALVKGHDLYVRAASGVEHRVTSDGQQWYSFDPRYARSNPVSRVKGAAGAPNVVWLPGPGRRFLVERWDFRDVGANWMIDSLAKPRPVAVEQRYALPGEKNLPRPEFWIVDADTGVASRTEAEGWAFVGNMDVGGGGFFPAPDGRTLLFTRMTRDYGVVELVELTLATGAKRVVLREANPKGFGVRYPQVTFIDGGRAILWKSDRGGRAQFWRVDVATGAMREATKGDFTVEQILHVDEDAGRLYFSAFGDGATGDPYYPHTWTSDMRTGRARRLDDSASAHVATFAPNGAYFVDTSSRVDLAPSAVVRGTDGKVLLDLGRGDVSGLSKLGWRAPERVHAKGADGKTDIYGVMWKPTDFDPARRYPVVVQVYPGPGMEGHPVGFAPHQPNTALAELGFVVVRIGQRGGSPVRDLAYARYAKEQGSVRDYPLADNRAALIALAATRPYMDLDRVGIIGESGGGFMTVAAMLAYPDFYKVGVAAAGNYDNLIYEMNSGEFYFGTPGQPGAAAYDSVATEAGKLKGALLIVHGDQDDDVSLANSVRLIDSLNRAGKRYDFLLLPGASHFNFEPATSEYYRRRFWGFLIDNLKPEPRP
jgi:dipeptidyl-peptidase-4